MLVDSSPIFDHTVTSSVEGCRVICSNDHNIWVGYLNSDVKKDTFLTSQKAMHWVALDKDILESQTVSFDSILKKCELEGITDCHFFSKENTVEIWLRKQTKLQYWCAVNHPHYKVLINQFKLHAGCDISNTTTPQDGQFEHNQSLSVRLSTCPTNHVEDLACRFLKKSTQASLDELGMEVSKCTLLKEICTKKEGLVLMVGPTGSGKTTTLYAALSYIHQNRVCNIVSIEDPVEKDIPGVRQSQINNQAGYTWDSALRSVLRQDPDVICVGEIRDEETAKLAIEAAHTGHLVFASMHAPSIELTLNRLRSLGSDETLLKSCLKAIFLQKLELDSNQSLLLTVEAKVFGK